MRLDGFGLLVNDMAKIIRFTEIWSVQEMPAHTRYSSIGMMSLKIMGRQKRYIL